MDYIEIIGGIRGLGQLGLKGVWGLQVLGVRKFRMGSPRTAPKVDLTHTSGSLKCLELIKAN